MTREEREQLNEAIFDLFVNKLKLVILTDEENETSDTNTADFVKEK